MKNPILFVTGRSVLRQPGDSHDSYVRIHAHAAKRAGYDVHVVCLAPEAKTERRSFGVVHAIPSPIAYVRQNLIPVYSLLLSRAIVQLVEEFGSKQVILHGFGVWAYAAHLAGEMLAQNGVRCTNIVSSYTTYVDENASHWRGIGLNSGLAAAFRYGLQRAWTGLVISRFERQTYCNADRILVNYKSVQRLIEARFGMDLPCQIIPYTLEGEFLESSEVTPSKDEGDGRPRIVCVSRHEPRKGIDVLLHALRALKGEGIDFQAHLLGGGVMLQAHRRLADKLGLLDRVVIMGEVLRIEPYLLAADVFVLPSREEQSGSLSLLEAMRSGVACVVSGCDGILEDVAHLKDVWLAEPGVPWSFTEGLRALIADAPLRRSLAQQGQRTFIDRFSPERLTDALRQVYSEVLDEHGPVA